MKLPKLLQKIVFSLLGFVILFSSIAPNFFIAHAQNTATAAATGTWYHQSPFEWYNKVFDQSVSPGNEIFGERYTAAQVQWVIYSVPSVIINLFVDPQITACVLTNSGNILSCIEVIKSLLASDTESASVANVKQPSLLSLVFTDRPLSGISYVRGVFQKFSLVPVAHAQSPGFGFDALAPVRDMWVASRNVAFGLFVLVAVVFAFMIMFRVKISPQVVISIQSAIPKLVIALILVTFSYAIAGFLVDLMYIVIGIFSIILPSFWASALTPQQAFNLLTLGNPGDTQSGPIGLIGFGLAYLMSFTLALIILLAQTISSILLGLALAATVASGVGGILLLLLVIIAVITCIWTMIRTFWALIKAFANILLLTIFAPLQITLGTFVPQLSFGQWAKSYCSNLGVFVGAGLLMALVLIFLGLAWDKTGIGFTPKFLSSILFGSASHLVSSGSPYWPPLLGSSNQDAGLGLLYLSVSFVLFTLIPKITEIIQGFISGKPFAYGTAVGEAMGLGRSIVAGQISAREEARKASLGNKYTPSTLSQVAGIIGLSGRK